MNSLSKGIIVTAVSAAFLLCPLMAFAGAYEDGERAYGAKNYQEARRLYEPLANNGDSRAQSRMGDLYYYGRGVPISYQKSFYWTNKAADMGHVESVANLAEFYEKGLGGAPKDLSKALELLRRAAAQNSDYAKSELIRLGVPYTQAKPAATATPSDAQAQVELGIAYLEGWNGPKRVDKAVELFQKAADSGNADGQSELAELYWVGNGVEESNTKALELFEKAASQGSANAQFRLGKTYLYGINVPIDVNRARPWIERSAKQGDRRAQRELGFMYLRGGEYLNPMRPLWIGLIKPSRKTILTPNAALL